jgi:hypothetical protein
VTSTAIIGDGRNDENLVIAQLHVAFLRFHNAIVDWVKANEPQHNTDAKRFRRARQLAQFHYQWLVIHDFLDTIAINGMADKVLNSDAHVFDPDGDDVFMPLEYSVAAYRFGHSMVRGAYDWNRNFGRPGTHFQPNASFQLLFRFTGKSPQPFFGATKTLPFNWIIEWNRFIDKGSSTKDHFARKIDTQLALPLRTMDNEGQPTGNPPEELPPIVKAILKSLPARNLLRGYSLGIPTGQQIAAVLGIEPLTPEELQRGNNQTLHDALEAGNFHLDTPLWYYVLKEAEVRANGNSLGELGSRIVCETIIGQIRVDPHSYLNHQGGWSPQKGVKLANGDPIVTIGDLLEFAGVMTTLPEGTDDP